MHKLSIMKKNIALVLSGGGARGIAHIGVIEELEMQGFEITSISGTSMGAVVGGVYALGKLKEFKNWLYSLDKKEVFKLIDFTFSSQGLVKGDKVFNKMQEFIPDSNIEDLKIDFSCIATDIINKKEVVYTYGDIFEAIRASVSIPTVLTPIKRGDSLLVDGGVINNIPINHVTRRQNDILIAIHVNADIPVYKPKLSKKEFNLKQSKYLRKIKEFEEKLKLVHRENHKDNLGYFDLINRTVGLMTNKISNMIIEKYPPDILINVSRDTCGLFDFYKAEELVEIGHYATRITLEIKE